MSLRSNKSVRLRIGPHTVAATLHRTWPRSGVMAHAQAPVEPLAESGSGAEHAAFGSHLSAIDSVLRELDANTPLAGASLAVELSDAMVHLDVVAGDFLGHNDRQLLGVANACVTELLGDDAPDHVVRWQLQSDDQHLLICAIARSLITLLEQTANARALRLVSVQPDFVWQWNMHARSLRAGPAVFAVSSRPTIAIAWVIDSVISALSVGPLFELAAPSSVATADKGIERAQAAERLDSRIGGLLLGFGLSGHARGAFSPTQPNALDCMDMLDARVDRLLATIGQDPASQSTFVLVAPDDTPPDASQRWAVLAHEKAAA